MVQWRFNELLERCRAQSGEPVLLSHIAAETGLALSTVYWLAARPPQRIALHTVDVLLGFFARRMGPLTTDDLIRFEAPVVSE